MNAFCFLDTITELKKNESLTALYKLAGTEEFLKDHFAGFPVMPGVLLLESLKQAASTLLAETGDKTSFYRLVRAEEVKFGCFVRPGDELKITVRLAGKENGLNRVDGRADVMENGSLRAKALSARLTLVSVTSCP